MKKLKTLSSWLKNTLFTWPMIKKWVKKLPEEILK